MVPSSRITTRLGPSAPRCSQIDADPGPPLKAKQTGRVAAGAFSRKYDVVNIAASTSPPLSSTALEMIGRNSATALYLSVLPPNTMDEELLQGGCAISL